MIIIPISEDDANYFMDLALGNDTNEIVWSFTDSDGKQIDVKFVEQKDEL
jgi:hypothetical protein